MCFIDTAKENNMKYFVLYENSRTPETGLTLYECDSARGVSTFIENMISSDNYTIDSFMVVEGTERFLKTIQGPIKVLISN